LFSLFQSQVKSRAKRSSGKEYPHSDHTFSDRTPNDDVAIDLRELDNRYKINLTTTIPSTISLHLHTNNQDKMSSTTTEKKSLHLIGIGVTHSIAPVMHNTVCQKLQRPYTFHATEAPTIEDAVSLLKAADFGGAVITMPYKQTIIPFLDGTDDLVATIGACNNVYTSADGRLIGSNTDWRGVLGCLTASDERGVEKPALIFGAGGASRAAVFALSVHLKCPEIYVVNRDAAEVEGLAKDTASMREAAGTRVVHVTSVEQARELETPFYIVGTVPDFAPESESEKTTFRIFEYFLASAGKSPGVFLDMCFKPLETRKIKLARKHRWMTVPGTDIIGHQIQEQYKGWFAPGSGEEVIDGELAKVAWEVLRQEAMSSPGINFEVDDVDLS
jgi:quinate dehydrogenase